MHNRRRHLSAIGADATLSLNAGGTVQGVRVAHAVRGISLPRGTKELPPGAPTGHHVPDHFPGDGNSDNDFGRVSAAWLR